MSIYDIAHKASGDRKREFWNHFIVITSYAVPFLLEFWFGITNRAFIKDFLTLAIGFNGSVLGLAIAGFAFTTVIPKELMVFMATTKADDYDASYYRQILLNYIFIFRALFSAILLHFVCYVLIIFPFDAQFNFNLLLISKAFLLSAVCGVQGWVLAELKIFLFWIYDNSLMLGQAAALDDKKEPYDPLN